MKAQHINRKKCVKCKAVENDNERFHRFPRPGNAGPRQLLKARVWARYCFPDKDWSNVLFLDRLYASNMVLCGRHFDQSSYTDNQHLHHFAIPYEATDLLREIREQTNADQDKDDINRWRLLRMREFKFCAVCGPISEHCFAYHEFPNPEVDIHRARVWAIFAYPTHDWDSKESLMKLYWLRKGLCSSHFPLDDYISIEDGILKPHANPVYVGIGDDEHTRKVHNVVETNVDEYTMEILDVIDVPVDPSVFEEGVVDIDEMFENADTDEPEPQKTLPEKDTYPDEYLRWLSEVNYMSKSCQTDFNYIDTGCYYRRKEVFNVVNNVLHFHNYTKINLEDICRLCAKTGCEKMVDLSINQNMIRQKISVLYPTLNFHPMHLLPQRVCAECYTHVENAYEFYECTVKCEQQLRMLFEADKPELQDDTAWPDLLDSTEKTEQEGEELIYKDVDPIIEPVNLCKFDEDKLSIEFVINKTNNMFQCPFCEVKRTTKRRLLKHFRQIHLNEPIVKEKIKKNKKESSKAKNSNADEIHNENDAPFEEHNDESRLNLYEPYVDHLLRINSRKTDVEYLLKRRYKCTKCELTFERDRDRIVHKKREHSHCYKCPVCEMVFASPDYVNEHSSSVHTIVTQDSMISKVSTSTLRECENCSSLYASTRALKVHKSKCIWTIRGTYMCRCSETFDNFAQFYTHFSNTPCTAKDAKKPKCKPSHICPFCLKVTNRFSRHIRFIHPSKMKEETKTYEHVMDDSDFQMDNISTSKMLFHISPLTISNAEI